MAGKKTGARKTVGRARKGDKPRGLMRLVYIQKPNGAWAPRYERVEMAASTEDKEPEPASA